MIDWYCPIGAQEIGGVLSTLDLVQTEDHGHRLLIGQAVYEMKKGSYDIALRYLDKALSVSITLILNGTYKKGCRQEKWLSPSS